jgi:hypothetical protein
VLAVLSLGGEKDRNQSHAHSFRTYHLATVRLLVETFQFTRLFYWVSLFIMWLSNYYLYQLLLPLGIDAILRHLLVSTAAKFSDHPGSSSGSRCSVIECDVD